MTCPIFSSISDGGQNYQKHDQTIRTISFFVWNMIPDRILKVTIIKIMKARL